AADEIENGTYPEIQDVPDLTAYDTVFVGTPCWWGTMAGPVHTFLTTADLSGKTVVPFNTHEGSGAGTVHTDIVGLTPDSKHARGIAIHGSDAANATDMVQTWLADIME
ncbi:flavodoxin, partial [bacterium]|nr:flavodoxin [bacterium]